jgi:ABC-type bacteriocin/lantibiotic exporter with double-glycine peptidase domain
MYAGIVALTVPLGLCVRGAAMVELDRMTGAPDADGVCLQSTTYTCAPAAMASFLALRGIPASEREMASLSHTNSVSGTSEFGILAALRRKGLRPHIGHNVLPAPCLVVVQFSSWMDHCVIVTAVEDDQVRLIDPLIGRMVEDRGSFDRRWRGVAIWVD